MGNEKIANLLLLADEPTLVTPDQLYRWVVWQFPRRYGKGLCGAVRPPLEKFGWIPAVVYEDKTAVQAQFGKVFETPEAAVSFLQQQLPR